MLEKLDRSKGYIKEKIQGKSKGALTTVEVLVIIAVLLLVTYPLYKGVINTFFITVSTWFVKMSGSIFS